ncbi:MAG TPA: hypothetical protein VGE41_03600 [Verrucomicrobiae bacterium]
MNIKKLALLCLLLLTCGGGVHAAESYRTDINPALLYFQGFILSPDLSQADRDYLYTGQVWKRDQPLPDKFGDLVMRYSQQLRMVRQAAHSSVPCDWGIDMTSGPRTLLPHLARCKVVAQAARLRAMWALQQSRPEDARDDLLGAFALARNSARDSVLIGVLVQIAMENILASAIAENFGKFPAETLAELERGVDGLPARGTVAGSISMEDFSFVDWCVREIKGFQSKFPGDEARIMQAIHDSFDFLDVQEEEQANRTKSDVWGKIVKASGGTSEGIIGLLLAEKPLYQQLAGIMALPPTEYHAQAKEFSAQIKNSTNPFVAISFPAFEKCRGREFTILSELAMLRAGIEFKLHGGDAFNKVLDPMTQSPFGFERFVFEGVDRGFKVKASYAMNGYPEVLIFVEKEGPAFYVNGKKAGQAVSTK